jgi:hypothetical protein
MNHSDSHKRRHIPASSPGADHTGAFVLVLLALAAVSGWYVMVLQHPGNTNPLPVFQKPLMPPSTTDTSSEFPGHTHYTLTSP